MKTQQKTTNKSFQKQIKNGLLHFFSRMIQLILWKTILINLKEDFIMIGYAIDILVLFLVVRFVVKKVMEDKSEYSRKKRRDKRSKKRRNNQSKN